MEDAAVARCRHLPLFLAGCGQTTHGMSVASLTEAITRFLGSRSYTSKDRECLSGRCFRVNRSSRDGMIAVSRLS
jgi:hypothetical protein